MQSAPFQLGGFLSQHSALPPSPEYFYRRQTTAVRLQSEPYLSFSMVTFPLFASERNYLPLSLLALSSLLLALYYVRTYAKLRHIPGPFLASLSNLSRRSWVLTGNSHAIHVNLHRRYGKVVRFGPNNVSVSDPSAIPEVYGFGAKFPKSEFYDAIMPYVRGKSIPDVFATRDETVHRTMKRPIANIYSMSNLVSFEPYVDSTMRYFFERLEELFVDQWKAFDFGHWLHLFAFDVMGELTFSKRLGFLENGGDIDGLLANNWNYFRQAAPATQMPWLDFLWKRNPLLPHWTKVNLIVAFGVARIKERQGRSEKDTADVNNRDFLSRFMEAKSKDPQIPSEALITWTNSNIQAGSDTTAILLSAIFYQLLKHPESMRRLQSELDIAAKQGQLSEYVTWKESRNLPYLDACVKEASRLHPPIAFPLERVTPAEGAVICGQHIAGETLIAMNPWVVNRDKDTFGVDAHSWRPERWLCDEDGKRKMYNNLLTFGAGHRACLGKNISYLEIYKVVPTLLHKYEMELENSEAEWHVENKWFAMPSNFCVRLRRR
ncbi:MAG: pisatin demethylase [Lasallia pustulata]|uniref:Pisatin demethylase n=1 Tax=Lasallia pustulata TaxID=136370 RepID=A0A5M8PS79_9LECA|nr:MAG: pisatin demethylase [Lasallia pustulata]